MTMLSVSCFSYGQYSYGMEVESGKIVSGGLTRTNDTITYGVIDVKEAHIYKDNNNNILCKETVEVVDFNTKLIYTMTTDCGMYILGDKFIFLAQGANYSGQITVLDKKYDYEFSGKMSKQLVETFLDFWKNNLQHNSTEEIISDALNLLNARFCYVNEVTN